MSFEPELIVAVLINQLVSLFCLAIKNTNVRRFLAGMSIVAMSLFFIFSLLNNVSFTSLALSIIAIYQIINVGRIVENRLNMDYLRQQVLKTTLALSLTTVGVPILTFTYDSNVPLLRLTSLLGFIGGLIVFITTHSKLESTKIMKPKKSYSDQELPTVSVLIPARNEDEQLSECIQSYLSSDYPKLEIIVLDDCSDDKSSDIIKRFAHSGVRFVSGETPKERWLAKNQAYETLAQASSGDWLVFGGVDVRVEPSTIRLLISHLLNNKLEMASVMPLKLGSTIVKTILMPMRYYWQIALPRGVISRPSALSTFWAIEKTAYETSGGFAANANSVEPESLFARAISIKNRYAFLRAGPESPILTNKTLYEQYLTAIRTLYPSLHRRVESVMFVSVLMTGFWFLPVIGIIYALGRNDYFSLVGHVLAYLLLAVSYVRINKSTAQPGWFLGLVTFPYSVLQEVCLYNISMYRYEFSEVLWKGRNICYPVMHITPHLPKLEDSPR